ncbi:unnamed protein product [Bursaphelenchus okinawaensis]|uniref:Peptidase S26 domain-containing protein n=1 Tax=Bursaphelenchus okinawaensis TaxID=465554 RepID=A0A811L3W5_9BILA|nr:unnamed protein product [Bursaphelenchus okinawaensis]CAG9118875.1 unnamed protein product [Bursaphelenchus okinawaensis]
MSAWSKIRSQFTLKRAKFLVYFYSTCYVINKHFGELIICRGNSMLPTLKDGDWVIGERFTVAKGQLKIGDIVCSLSPVDPRVLLCKRIAFMGADKIEVDQEYEAPLKRVPLGHCYLLGDNSAESQDSRHIGPVPVGLVQVKLSARVWPPSRIGWIEHHGSQ